MLTNLNRVNDAHDILKQALSTQNNNLNLRAFYTHFLIHIGSAKVAKEFVFTTLKDSDRHDVYSLCSSAWIIYQQARESRDTSQKGVDERKKNFQRAADFYEKALQLDPTCAFAAQGLAIVTAEDALGTMNGALSRTPAPDESQRRLQNAHEALDIFLKVRESINDGGVYFNIGHCYYGRDEFDRAIESVSDPSVDGMVQPDDLVFSVRNCVYTILQRAEYFCTPMLVSFMVFEGHERSVIPCDEKCAQICPGCLFFAEICDILLKKYILQALHIHPHDKAILYNIAMIQQKSAELLFSINVTKRSLKDLQRAIDSAAHAQK